MLHHRNRRHHRAAPHPQHHRPGVPSRLRRHHRTVPTRSAPPHPGGAVGPAGAAPAGRAGGPPDGEPRPPLRAESCSLGRQILRVAKCLLIAIQLRLVVTGGERSGRPRASRGVAPPTFLAAAAAANGDSAVRCRFCGKPSRSRRPLCPLGLDFTKVARSVNVRMLSEMRRDAVPKGLMASCDFFAWRSMPYGTYASANS